MYPKFWLMFLLASILFGCDREVPVLYPKNTETVFSPCSNDWPCPPDNSFRVVTFNVGLAPGVQPLVSQRYSTVARNVAQELERSDLICLQEVWTDEGRQAIIDAVQLPQENIFWFDSRGNGEDAKDRCSDNRISGLMQCLKKECADELPENKGICARRECFWHLAWLYLRDRPCLNCLISMTGHSEEEAHDTCVNGPGASRVYHGHNGVLLLSRNPLHRTEAVILPASGSNRAVLMATVTLPSGHEIEVGCTHISSKINKMKPLNSKFKNWEEEQAAQLELIDNHMIRRSQGQSIQVLIGDMNFSWEHGFVKSEMLPSWNLMVEHGFDSPVARAEPPVCSLCVDNFFNPTKRPRMVDHVLLRQPAYGGELVSLCAERVLDQPVTVLDNYGQPVTVSISDHFGIAAEFCLVP